MNFAFALSFIKRQLLHHTHSLLFHHLCLPGDLEDKYMAVDHTTTIRAQDACSTQTAVTTRGLERESSRGIEWMA